MAQQLHRGKSRAIYEALCRVIPGGVNSPVRSFKSLSMPPLIADRAAADTLVDADGKKFIDYCLSWGALIHGHANRQIEKKVIERLKKGSSFGLSTKVEGDLAKKICTLVPSCEKVRFVSSGTEATMSAVRLARGATSRSTIIKFDGCYHGHADPFLVRSGSGTLEVKAQVGVPQAISNLTLSLPYNDTQAVEKLFASKKAKDIACVIIEPIATNMGLVAANPEFLHLLRKKTAQNGSLLIFDEVVTGFRVALGGAQSLYGIQPDLTCFGKIIGGGFPCGAFGGAKAIMDLIAPCGPVYQAGTLSGNPVAMAAGCESLSLVEEKSFYKKLEKKAERLLDPLEDYIQKNNKKCTIARCGSCFTLFFGRKSVHNLIDSLSCDAKAFNKFFRHLFERGIYIPPSPQEVWTISSVHTEKHLDYTRDICLEYLKLCE